MMDDILLESRHKILLKDRIGLFEYGNGKVYYSSSASHITKCSAVPVLAKGAKRFFSKVRWCERLLRMEPRFAFRDVNNDVLFSCGGHLWKYNTDKNSVDSVIEYENGVNNPLDMCVINENGSQTLVYGDYGWNTDHGEVNIYEYKDEHKRKLCSFAPGEVLHIHTVKYDSEMNCFFVLTGDENKESGIWMIKRDGSEITPIAKGSQEFRACVLYRQNNELFYATDTPLEKNYIYQIPLSETDKAAHKLFEMPGPCVYSTTISIDNELHYVFATSVEPDSSMRNRIRYRLTYKLGRGVADSQVHLIIGNINKGFKDILSMKKDLLPMWLFQFGNVQFANTDTNELIITPTAVKKYDGKSISIPMSYLKSICYVSKEDEL